jgi:transcription antitermination factor NusG
MNVAHSTSILNDNLEGGLIPSHVRLTPDVIPEVSNRMMVGNRDLGVSTQYAPLATTNPPHWFALRTTYGREKKAYEYLIEKKVIAFCPMITSTKLIKGKRRIVSESRLPNIFFAYGTEEEIRNYVYDNIHLPYLRFYYIYTRKGKVREKQPLIVPDKQIESLKIICAAESDNIIVTNKQIPKLESGRKVRITHGKFAGVTGIVSRCYGQKRVAVVVPGLLTVCTAYIPGAFLELED